MFLARLLSGIAAMPLSLEVARAGEFVTFDGGALKPLVGYLARPPGAGPFPAVVVLHGCGGFHSTMVECADRLRRFGYVALAVGSFGPRGLQVACGNFGPQVADAFDALAYLAKQPFVRTDQVGALGFSMGGSSVLALLERGGVEKLHAEKFRAGVAFYPSCGGYTGLMAGPTLVLIGGLDDWTSAKACEAMVAGRDDFGISRKAGDRSMVRLIVYPDAHHAFDAADLRFSPGVVMLGHRLEYNDAATKDSIGQVRPFFEHAFAP